ncbi:HEAT repeat domain-containing protein, partial [Photobacterium sanctipauli]|uniref:HEAT repeat domain-containing protein n=1 Tax=Photobacterium sanctipauli TaxID=1342794 RepID=UPI001C1DFACA
FDKEMPPTLWVAFFTSHAIACASFTALSWILLPKKYKRPVVSSMSFLFFFNYFLPLIGMLGTACSLLVALYLPRKPNIVTWEECEKSPLPQNPGDEVNTQFGTGALREILLHNGDPERRLLAVGAIRHLPRQHAVPLLQLALKDLTDDVRLLAYASLESIETQINESLSLFKRQLAHQPSANKAYEVAQQYWELCYLGIAEGVLRKHYLEQAEQYLHQANVIQDSASSNLLLGRVLLEQQRPKEATIHLERALEGGLLVKQVAPYLAEAAYRSGDYQIAKQYIAYFPEQKGEKLSQIKEYWV